MNKATFNLIKIVEATEVEVVKLLISENNLVGDLKKQKTTTFVQHVSDTHAENNGLNKTLKYLCNISKI